MKLYTYKLLIFVFTIINLSFSSVKANDGNVSKRQVELYLSLIWR